MAKGVPARAHHTCAHTYTHMSHTYAYKDTCVTEMGAMMMFFTFQQHSESKQKVSDQPMPCHQQGERGGAMGGRSSRHAAYSISATGDSNSPASARGKNGVNGSQPGKVEPTRGAHESVVPVTRIVGPTERAPIIDAVLRGGAGRAPARPRRRLGRRLGLQVSVASPPREAMKRA